MEMALILLSNVPMNFDNYQMDNFYDELFEAPGQPRASAAPTHS